MSWHRVDYGPNAESAAWASRPIKKRSFWRQADVYYLDPKTGDKKPIGKTPLELPTAQLKKLVGDGVVAGEYFTVVIEKQGFLTEKFQVPAIL